MKHYLEQMPLYLAGQLEPAEVAELEKHLSGCPTCQDELDFWQTLAGEIKESDSRLTAPVGLAEHALRRIHAEEAVPNHLVKPFTRTFLSTLSLLRAQAYLIKRELWPASAAVMALSVMVAFISNHIEAVTFMIPLVAAASLAMLYGSDHDPAHELALATPTSPWKILLARLSVVSAYDLLLALLASLAMLWIVPPDLLGMITLGWLAPMAFLSALALLISLWVGTGNAILLTYGLWIIQFLKISQVLESWGYPSNWDTFLSSYRSFWQSPGLLLVLSLVLLVVALFSTRFTERGLSQSPA